MRIFLSFLLFCILSCVPSRASNSSTSGYVTDGTIFKWPINPQSGLVEIEVCWENLPASENQARAWVENVVNREYGRVNFRFTGWLPCEANSPGIHVVSMDVNNNRAEKFGYPLNKLTNGVVLNLVPSSQYRNVACAKDEASLRVCLEVIALHEFGHAIGLRHEANRPDSTCTLDQFYGAGEQGALAVGGYDADSIMNYCANGQSMRLPDHSPRLSSGDIQTLREYYFGTSESPVFASSASSCKKEGNRWNEYDNGTSCCEVINDLSENAPYKYCSVPLLFDLTTLDFAKVKEVSSASEVSPCGYAVQCSYANGRKAFQFAEEESMDRPFLFGQESSKKALTAYIEPNLSDLSCNITFYIGNATMGRTPYAVARSASVQIKPDENMQPRLNLLPTWEYRSR